MSEARVLGRRMLLRGRSVMLLAAALCCGRGVAALDPALDLTQYTHTSWTGRDGLRGSIRAIVQTPDGYLWIGTEFGLIRFDGVRFVPWSPPTGQHLRNLNIMVLLASRDGTLWIGTIDGLASWKNDELTQYAEFAGAPVMSLLEDHEGTVWVGASGKLCGIRGGKAKCAAIENSSGSGRYDLYGNRAQSVMSLYEDKDGHLWAGTESNVWQWKPGPPKLILPQPISTQQGLAQGDRANQLVIISGNNFVLRQVIKNKPYDYVLPGGQPVKPWRLLRDRHGALWIGTLDQGLLRVYQGRAKRFSLNNGLSGNLVTVLFEDREGTIWVGTVNGLDRFREPAVNTVSGHQGLSTPAWSVITARDGSVWIGTLDGLNRWKEGQLTIYRSTPSLTTTENHDIDSSRAITDPTLPGNEVHSLFEDQQGRIWVTTSRGVAWFGNGRFTRVSGVPAGTANAITPDQHEGVWISFPNNGLFHVVEGRTIKSVPWPWPQKSDKRVSAIVSDPVSGMMWVGFLDGGISYLKDGKIERTITTKDGLGADRVWNLRFGRDDSLWAATQGGLSRIKDNRVATLTTKNGLPCDAVNWVMEDDSFSTWLYTVCGLLRVDRTELEAWELDSKRIIQSTLFDGSDGVRMHALLTGYSPVVARARDGKLWFAHADGVSFIDPHNLRVNKLPPPVHVEQITADGKQYAAVNGLQLPPRIRDLTIDYTALSMVAPEKVRFRYKLEGQDNDWREVVNDRKVQYSNLQPGSYHFLVKACNNSGVWNEEGASLDFLIPPAWYQTNWFRAACLVVILALIWLVYRQRIREVEEREKKFREAVESMPALAFIAASENERTFVNKGWVEYTGLTLKQASGSGWQGAVHPEDLKRVLGKWRTAVSTGEPLDYEVRLRHSFGGEYRWFHTRVVPLQDKRGKIMKWCGVATDIEDRKRAQEALRESETLLRTFVDHAVDAFFMLDSEQGTIIDVNQPACESLGYTRQELIGKTPLAFDMNLDRATLESVVQHTAAGETVLFDRHWHRRKDGSLFPVEVHTSGFRHGERRFLLKVARDISDRLRAEAELEKLQQLEADLALINRVSMMGELAASIAHEVNQPLSGVVSNGSACLRWLAGDAPNLEEAREAARRIVRDGKRAGDVIARTRALTKRAVMTPEKLDLNETIREVLALVGDEAKKNGVVIRTEFWADVLAIFGDRVQLQQVVLNLVMNGVEAMSSVGDRPREVVITTQNVDSDQIQVGVEDSGTGLDPEAMTRIFDPFYSTKPGGMGMGLSISRSIIEAHGGRLWATGKDSPGTIFHFTVPKYREEQSNERA